MTAEMIVFVLALAVLALGIGLFTSPCYGPKDEELKTYRVWVTTGKVEELTADGGDPKSMAGSVVVRAINADEAYHLVHMTGMW